MEPDTGDERVVRCVCAICDYPVRDVERDFGPDGDHAHCGAVIDRMEDAFAGRQTTVPPWAAPW